MRKAIITVLFMVMFFCSYVFAASGSNSSLNELNFDIYINKDGSATVTEEWNVETLQSEVLKTSLLVNELKAENVSDVKVSRIINNTVVEINSGDYTEADIKENHYSVIYDNPIQILSASGKYSDIIISYTIKDFVTLYNDCADVQLNLRSDSNVKSKVTNIRYLLS